MLVICRECGAVLDAEEIEQAGHECSFDQLVAFQLHCARVELEQRLAAQVAVWERDPRLSRRIEFARYLRDRSERRTPDRTRERRLRPAATKLPHL